MGEKGKINGPPGTGKTMALMRALEIYLGSNHIAPHRIAFSSFTRAAVGEAKSRAFEMFGLEEEEMPFFGTLHSLCYRHLGVTKEALVTPKRFKEFCDEEGYRCNPQEEGEKLLDDTPIYDPTAFRAQNEGMTLLTFCSWMRCGMLQFDEAYRSFSPPNLSAWLSKYRVQEFVTQYELWKRREGLIDFEDMIQRTLETNWAPPVEVLMLDEAQDLSRSQRRLFMAWADRVGSYIVAYDEDQAIYTWQFAEPEWLLELPGQTLLLTKSLRVPAAIHERAVRLIGRNRKRMKDKQWSPKQGDHGRYVPSANIQRVVREIRESAGSWFLLSRNRYYLDAYAALLMDQGIPFVNERGYSPLNHVASSVKAAMKLATGGRITVHELTNMSRATPQEGFWERGAKAKIERMNKQGDQRRLQATDLASIGGTAGLIHELMDLNTALNPLVLERRKASTKRYYARLVKDRGLDALSDKPRLTLTTTHAAKGREADNVAMVNSMTRRTFHAYLEDPEPERRVCYVGMTRARNALWVVDEARGYQYDDI